MIIFYNKKTGKIVGTIQGRIHSKAHLKMWVGDRNKTKRIIVNWFKPKEAKEFEPDHQQKDLFIKLDKDSRKLKEYKVDLKTKDLISCL